MCRACAPYNGEKRQAKTAAAEERAVVIDRKKPGGGSAGKTGGPRLFLRSDVEACAASRHQHQGEAAAHQRKAKADWKANTVL